MPTVTRTIRILICDDHALLREGVATLLSTEPDIKLIAEASNGEEAVEKFRMHHPDVTLMDLQMPGLSGIDAIARIRSEFPDAKIIVLTTYTGDSQVIGALRAGARAYLLKAHVHRELPEIIRGEGSDLFDVSGTSQRDDVVLFLYIDFTVNQRDIRGYIALLMDLSSLESLRALLRDFIQRTIGESPALSYAAP